MLNHAPSVRMTASRAEEILRTAERIVPVQLTELHLDVLQCSDLDLGGRCALGPASDAVRAGMYRPSDAVLRCVEEWNARAGR